MLLKRHILGHFYRNCSPYIIYNYKITHNALLVAELLMPRRKVNFCYASAMYGNYGLYTLAINQLSQNFPLITELKEYYHKIFTHNYSYFEEINSRAFDAARERSMPKMQELYTRFTSACDLQHPESVSLTDGGGFNVLARSIGGRIFPHNNDNDGLGDAYSSYIAMVEPNTVSNLSFERGIFGIGWLIIYLHHAGCISDIPFDILERIDRLCSAAINDLPITGFDTGIGGLLCYATARLYAAEFEPADLPASFNVDFLLQLCEKAQTVIATPGCEFRTYLNALEFLNAANNASPWEPDVRDWLKEPDSSVPAAETATSVNERIKWLMAAANILNHKTH